MIMVHQRQRQEDGQTNDLSSSCGKNKYINDSTQSQYPNCSSHFVVGQDPYNCVLPRLIPCVVLMETLCQTASRSV